MSKWILGVALGLAVATTVQADTVITKDGRKFSGEVTRTDDGYLVRTKMGSIPLGDSDVDRIVKDADLPAPPPAVTAVTPPAAGPSQPTPASVKPAAKPIDSKSLDALVHQGEGALGAGEYAAARDAFSDAASIDPKNVTALEGQAVASMYLNDFARAQKPMDLAMALSHPLDRAIVLNAAVMEIGLKNPMRAVKYIRDYLNTHPTELDEPMLNALAIALNNADDQAKKAPLFTDAVEFYKTYNAKVEEAVPGQKRWGTQWLPASEVDEKMKAWSTSARELDRLRAEAQEADQRVADAAASLDAINNAYSRKYSGFEVDRRKGTLASARQMQTERWNAVHDAELRADKPQFPHTMTLVAMDNTKPPAITGTPVAPVTVAINTDPEPDATPIKKLKKHKNPSPDVPEVATDPQPNNQLPKGPTAPPIQIVAPKSHEDRKVDIVSYAVAFPVAPDLVLTAASAVEGASEIQLQGSDGISVKGTVVRCDNALGIGLVRLTGRTMHPLAFGSAFSGGSVQCATFPTANIFNPNPEMLMGSASAANDAYKLRLSRNPRLPGAPLLAGGKVVGMELALRDSDPGALPCVTAEQLTKFLGSDAPSAAAVNGDALGSVLQVTATRESK